MAKEAVKINVTLVKIIRGRSKRGMRWYNPTNHFPAACLFICVVFLSALAAIYVYFHNSFTILQSPICSWGDILAWCVLLWGSLGERQMTWRLLSTMWWPVDRLGSRSRCDSQGWSAHTKAGMTWRWCPYSTQPNLQYPVPTRPTWRIPWWEDKPGWKQIKNFPPPKFK